MRSSSRGGGGLISGKPGVTTQIISGQSGLRHSLRSSGSGKIWKKTVQGKKFEFAGKLREKKNYIMYHSGMGHEKNVIEEFEKLPDPGPKIVEERQVIDNYGYYETKDLKKKKDPKRISITRHQRLSSPFERTVVKKYEHNTSRPQETKVYSSSTLKSSKYGGGTDNKLNKYNSHTSKIKKNYTVEPSKLYETYKPKTTTSYTKTITTTTTNRAPIRTKVNEYTLKTISRLGKPTIKKSKYVNTTSSSSTSNYLHRYEPKSSYIETEPNKTYGFGDTQTKTETTQDGDYLIKITTSKTKLGGDYGSKYISSRTKSVPKSTYLESVIKTRENPSFVYRTAESKDNLYEEENQERVNEQTLENPETFEISHSEYKTSNSSYGEPHPQPTFGTRYRYGASRLKQGYGPRPVEGLGPRPTIGPRPGNGPNVHRPYGARPYEVISHKPNCPLYEGNLNKDQYRAESQSGKSRFGNNTFSGVKREYSEVKKYSSTGRYRTGDRSFDLGHASLNTGKKKTKTGGSSKYSYQKVTTTDSRGGRNYNYFESKDIKKKKKKQPKTSFQYNRSGISSLSSLTNSVSKKHQRSSSSSYNRAKGYKSSNINNYSFNMPIINSRYTSNIGGNQSTRRTTFKLTANKSKKNKELSSGITSQLNARVPSRLNSDIRRTTSTTEYQKYEQRGAGGPSSNYGSSSYHNDYRREEENYGGESKYQYHTEYNRGGPEYGEDEDNYEYRNNEYQNNEYRYGEDGRSGDFSSQYQYMDDNEYEIVYCPVHGKQTIRKKRNYDEYY